MKGPFLILTGAAALFGCAAPALSQLTATAPSAAAASSGSVAPPLSRRPFLRMFMPQAPPPALVPFRERLAAPDTTPPRTCGLIVLPADPRLDPTFERRPADSARQFTIRIIPWFCR